MYYLELIQRFWDFNKNTNPGATAIAMYLYLLKIGKDNQSYDFRISDVVLSKELGLTRKTIKFTKEKLQNLGLIQFQTKNGLAGSYRLILNYPLHISVPKKIHKIKLPRESVFQEPEEGENPLQTNLPIHCLPEIGSTQNRNSSLQPSNDINSDIPDLIEFMAYAQTLEAYESQLDLSIKEKYKIWAENGWRNTSNRPITSWKSSLRNIVPYMKNDAIDTSILIQSIPNIKHPKPSRDKK